MDCCTNCFEAPYLKGFIKNRSTKQGDCPVCHSRSGFLVDEREIASLIESLCVGYIPDGDDGTLIELIQEDWGTFSHTAVEGGKAAKLLTRILALTWDDDDG